MTPKANYVDLASASYNCDTTGSIVLVPTIAQGAGNAQRVGKKIAFKSIMFRGACNANSAGVVNSCALILVYDKRPTGSLPAITDILDTAHVNSMNKDDNTGRFKILYRKEFTLMGNSTTPATGKEAEDANMYLSLRGMPCVFKSAGTGAIGDIEEGAIYAVTVGNNAAGTSAATLTGGFRVRFYDIAG